MLLTLGIVPVWLGISLLTWFFIWLRYTERKEYVRQPPPVLPTPPIMPPAGIPAPEPEVPEKVDEGLVWYQDPLVWMFIYIPAMLSILMLSSILFGLFIDAGVGLVLIIAAFHIFKWYAKKVGPLTLGIRVWARREAFFRDTFVLVIPWLKMDFQRIVGLQDIHLESDHTNDNRDQVIESFMQMAIPPSAPGTENILNRETEVEIAFDGLVTANIDIERPRAVLALFYEDMQSYPHISGGNLAEESKLRSTRVVLPLIAAASDALLQLHPWTDAISGRIGALNRELEAYLKADMASRYAIIVKNVVLSKAYGVPIDELRKQGAATQKATTQIVEAQATRDTKIAVAQADSTSRQEVARVEAEAVITEAEEKLRRERINQVLEQQYHDLRKTTLEKQRDADSVQQAINQLELVARLQAIENNKSSFILNSFYTLDATQRAAAWNEALKILKPEAPETLVTVGPAALIDAFGSTAVAAAIERGINAFTGRTQPSSTPGTPPTLPAAGSSPPAGP